MIGYVNDRATPRPMSLEKSDWLNILQNSSHVGIISSWGFAHFLNEMDALHDAETTQSARMKLLSPNCLMHIKRKIGSW
jgi:hypothetical protein